MCELPIVYIMFIFLIFSCDTICFLFTYRYNSISNFFMAADNAYLIILYCKVILLLSRT